MDIRPYVELIMDKFKSANGYTDLEEESLYLIISKDLQDLYDEEISALCLKLELEENHDLIGDADLYKKEQLKIKTKVLRRSKEIAKTSKED